MVTVMFIVEVGVGFCQSPWLHPNEHSRAPHYLDWMDQLEADAGWERASLLTTLPSGRLVRMSAHAIDSGENAWVHINGDMRWVVRMNDPLGSITDEEEAAVKDNKTLNVLGVLPWIVTVLMACWLWLERQKRSNRREPGDRLEKGGAEPAAAKMQYSALTQMILDHTGKHFETEELDELLVIAHLESPDTLRSQRARMIQRVNTEFRVTQGHDLIVRKRAFNDRRRSVYFVGEVDEQGSAGEGPGQGRDA